jgi:hypothetical protein
MREDTDKLPNPNQSLMFLHSVYHKLCDGAIGAVLNMIQRPQFSAFSTG